MTLMEKLQDQIRPVEIKELRSFKSTADFRRSGTVFRLHRREMIVSNNNCDLFSSFLKVCKQSFLIISRPPAALHTPSADYWMHIK